METPVVPFTVLGLGAFDLRDGSPWVAPPLNVDPADIDQAVKALDVSLRIPLPETLHPAGDLRIHISGLRDFHPDRLIENSPSLKNLLEAGKFIQTAGTRGLSEQEMASRLREWPDLPSMDVDLSVRPVPPAAVQGAEESAVERILSMVAVPTESSAPAAGSKQLSGGYEKALGEIVRIIFENRDFRKIEAAWRGLQALLKQGGISETFRYRIVSVSMETLEETLDALLLRLLDDLPSLILIDLPFDATPRSLQLLQKVATLAETLMAPAICSITPGFFRLESWKDLEKVGYLPHYLDGPLYAQWKRLRQLPASRWLALTCNGFLTRYPYGPENPPKLVRFREGSAPFSSPVWALGSLILQSINKTGWPTAFSDSSRIRIEDLPVTSCLDKDVHPTEVVFSEERAAQFIKGGIIPLVAARNRDIAFTPMETTVHHKSDSLKGQLFVSRITRFLFQLRDHIAEGMEPAEVEAQIRKGFTSLWEMTGAPMPDRLDISVSRTGPLEPPVVSLAINPPHAVMPSTEAFSLQFDFR
jgi:hypothetical protein